MSENYTWFFQITHLNCTVSISNAGQVFHQRERLNNILILLEFDNPCATIIVFNS
jgi:hypothetical protein